MDRPANGVSVLMEISFGEFDSQKKRGGGGGKWGGWEGGSFERREE